MYTLPAKLNIDMTRRSPGFETLNVPSPDLTSSVPVLLAIAVSWNRLLLQVLKQRLHIPYILVVLSLGGLLTAHHHVVMMLVRHHSGKIKMFSQHNLKVVYFWG